MNLGKAEKKFAFAQASATYIAGLWSPWNDFIARLKGSHATWS